MSPNFLPDSFVFSVSHPLQKYTVGDVILINHVQYGKMIKRISMIQTNKKYRLHKHDSTQKIKKNHIQHLLLSGDNIHSVSTQQMGKIMPVDIIGRVIYQVTPD